MKQFEYRLNSGNSIRLNDVKFYSGEDNSLNEFQIHSIPVEAQTITVFDDSYEHELNHINEEIQFKIRQIEMLNAEIAGKRSEIYDLQNERDKIYDFIEKNNTMGEEGNGNKNNN
jgi:hypothetical protein